MENKIDWLLKGDVSIEYQTRKYLLGESGEELDNLKSRIAKEGWGKAFLEARLSNGHWGRDFYQVKWISTHYTLLDLRYLEIEPVAPILETLDLILDTCKSTDGSINESHKNKPGDVCINGMFLNYGSFFGLPESELCSVMDFVLDSRLPDGGFNCDFKKSKGAVHSSVHTTMSVLEGLEEFLKAGYTYKDPEIRQAKASAEEFLLQHRLYKSDKTHEIIDKKWTMLSYPPRWKYDILRALIYFADAGVPYDPRMADALELLLNKRDKQGFWPVQAKHAGLVHFDMEKTGTMSRWNTLRAMRVLKQYMDSPTDPKTGSD